MSQIEVAFKILDSKEQAERILIEKGFKNLFKTVTRDIYFGKNYDFRGKSEEQIKRSLIRWRNLGGFDNLSLLDDKFPNRKKYGFRKSLKIVKILLKDGYEIVFDTKKSDWVYEKDKYCHQLQDIKDIGLLDYVYAKFDEDLSEDEMFENLKKHMQELGLSLEYDLGVDKLRSLYCKKLMFSKNQIGLYEYQE